MESSVARTSCLTLGNRASVAIEQRLGEPQSQSGYFGKERNFFTCWESNPRFSSLNPSHYTENLKFGIQFMFLLQTLKNISFPYLSHLSNHYSSLLPFCLWISLPTTMLWDDLYLTRSK